MPALDTKTLDQLISDYFKNGRRESLSTLAAPYSVDELIHAFQGLRRTTMRQINGLTVKQINFNPDANTYSVSEIISHLVAAQGMTYNGFLDIVSSTLPHVDPVPRDPGGGAEKGLTSQILQERLQKATDDLIDVLRKTHDPSKENRELPHPVAGSITYKAWMFFQLAHDLDHLKQLQVLRRSAHFPSKKD